MPYEDTKGFLNYLAVPAKFHGAAMVWHGLLAPSKLPVVVYRQVDAHADLPFCVGMAIFKPGHAPQTIHIEYNADKPEAWDWLTERLVERQTCLAWASWEVLIGMLLTHQDNLDNAKGDLFSASV